MNNFPHPFPPLPVGGLDALTRWEWGLDALAWKVKGVSISLYGEVKCNYVHLFFAGLNCYDPESAVACTGLPATRSCEPRQTRKGAAVAMDAGAGARRVWVAAFE